MEKVIKLQTFFLYLVRLTVTEGDVDLSIFFAFETLIEIKNRHKKNQQNQFIIYRENFTH